MEEIVNKGTLFKIRSYSSCFKQGFELYIKNFKLLFKYLWIPMAIYAIFEAAVMWMAPMLETASQTGQVGTVSLFILILMVVAIVVYSLLMGPLFTLFNKYKELGYIPNASLKAHQKDVKHYIWRNVKAILWFCLYTAIISVVVGFVATGIVMVMGVGKMGTFLLYLLIITVCIVILLAAYIPLIYVYIKYMMNDGGFFKMFKKSFAIGFRHWGSLFVLTLITYIIVLLAMLVINLPEYIIIIVKYLSSNAIADGDPSGLPFSFGWLSTIVVAICSFVQIFASMFFFFPMLFLFGSIDTEENERKKFTQQDAQNDYEMMESTNKEQQ